MIAARCLWICLTCPTSSYHLNESRDWKIFVKIFVSATELCRSDMFQKSNRTEFERPVATTKFCCRLLEDFHKTFSITHKAICRCYVSSQHGAATSRRTCTHGVICRRDMLLQTCHLMCSRSQSRLKRIPSNLK